ncbi:hypothetical protein TUBRATIS_16440 [Tubulinosema ratisbonensis]|uniref:Uncharacterized protein n=1 Tax=Tubulinosema ratisbonensis TaxID=291195 RepID=A0A437AL42_9MICR|nr:hypothetical protein TUBRATIS_16440 [Tubulinosema ratisbonensis]
MTIKKNKRSKERSQLKQFIRLEQTDKIFNESYEKVIILVNSCNEFIFSLILLFILCIKFPISVYLVVMSLQIIMFLSVFISKLTSDIKSLYEYSYLIQILLVSKFVISILLTFLLLSMNILNSCKLLFLKVNTIYYDDAYFLKNLKDLFIILFILYCLKLLFFNYLYTCLKRNYSNSFGGLKILKYNYFKILFIFLVTWFANLNYFFTLKYHFYFVLSIGCYVLFSVMILMLFIKNIILKKNDVISLYKQCFEKLTLMIMVLNLFYLEYNLNASTPLGFIDITFFEKILFYK